MNKSYRYKIRKVICSCGGIKEEVWRQQKFTTSNYPIADYCWNCNKGLHSFLEEELEEEKENEEKYRQMFLL